MTVYAGLDVHRKRTQVAILDEDGSELLNRNVPNDPGEMIEILGSLEEGTGVAFEAAYGWGWLAELLDEIGPDLRGRYLNRRDQEKRDLDAVFGVLSRALAPLRELAATI